MVLAPEMIVGAVMFVLTSLIGLVIWQQRILVQSIAKGRLVTEQEHARVCVELVAERARSERLEKSADIRADMSEALTELLKTNVAILGALPRVGAR